MLNKVYVHGNVWKNTQETLSYYLWGAREKPTRESFVNNWAWWVCPCGEHHQRAESLVLSCPNHPELPPGSG